MKVISAKHSREILKRSVIDLSQDVIDIWEALAHVGSIDVFKERQYVNLLRWCQPFPLWCHPCPLAR